MSIVECTNVTKTYLQGQVNVLALRGVNLTIEKGGFVEEKINFRIHFIYYIFHIKQLMAAIKRGLGKLNHKIHFTYLAIRLNCIDII